MGNGGSISSLSVGIKAFSILFFFLLNMLYQVISRFLADVTWWNGFYFCFKSMYLFQFRLEFLLDITWSRQNLFCLNLSELVKAEGHLFCRWVLLFLNLGFYSCFKWRHPFTSILHMAVLPYLCWRFETVAALPESTFSWSYGCKRFWTWFPKLRMICNVS